MYGVRYFKAANESKWNLEKCIVPITRTGIGVPGQALCSAIRRFGVFLYRTITQSSSKPYSEMKALAPDEFIKQKVERLTPLTSFLFGLATGKNQIETATIVKPVTGSIDQTEGEKVLARKTQSQFAAIASAGDMLHRSTSEHPCELQLMMNRRP